MAVCPPSAPEAGSFPPVLSDPAKRNVLILAICQALYMTGTSLMIATGPLAGKILTPAPGWETLPLATHHAGVMLATIPASHLMRRIGRRAGFMFGTIFGVIGAIMAGYGMLLGSFWMLCAGACVIGWFNGFAVFYRFAAADTASDEFKPKAISWVMTGGLVRRFLGAGTCQLDQGYAVANHICRQLFCADWRVCPLLLHAHGRPDTETLGGGAQKLGPTADPDIDAAKMRGCCDCSVHRLWRYGAADDIDALGDAELWV